MGGGKNNSSGSAGYKNFLNTRGRPAKYKTDMKVTTVYLPKPLYESIRNFANKHGKSVNETIVLILSSYDERLVSTLMGKWTEVLELTKKQIEELKSLKAILNPSSIISAIDQDEKILKLIEEFLTSEDWIERAKKVYQSSGKFQLLRTIKSVMLDSFMLFLAEKGYKLNNRKDAEYLLIRIVFSRVK